jgi:DNA (cytosine-5)-methyltransferase 1
MNRPLLLDLFCGAGGAAMGYHRAGFDVVGVDNDPAQLEQYPFPSIKGDALRYLKMCNSIRYRFDAIQRYSTATKGTGRPDDHPDLIPPIRELLIESGTPYVIENVPGAPLRPDVTLCGSMFGLSIRRHRIFELGGWWTMQSGCAGHDRDFVDLTGHAGGRNQTPRPGFQIKYRDTEHARELIGMPWATSRGCTEAIPPAYTEWIGAQLLQHVRAAA